MRTRLRLCLAALAMIMLVAGVLTVTLRREDGVAEARSDSVTTVAAPVPASEVTTTTIDPAPFEYAAALQRSEEWAAADFVARVLTTWKAAEDQGRAEQAARAKAYQDTRKQAPAVVHLAAPRATGGGGSNGSFLDCVKRRESGGSYTAVNPSSGAGGAYQFMPGTWNNMHTGYPTPQSAPPSVQDDAARRLYAGGSGAGHWSGGQYNC